jgi:hypothetical protein
VSVFAPHGYGFILCKDRRTATFIAQWRQAPEPGFPLEDEHLVSLRVAMGPYDMPGAIRDLEAAGAVRGIDFIEATEPDGVLLRLPPWLEEVPQRPETFDEFLRHRGFSRELWERFGSEVQRMWLPRGTPTPMYALARRARARWRRVLLCSLGWAPWRPRRTQVR